MHSEREPDRDLASLRAELAAARARAGELERELMETVGSPTWRLASRLRAGRRRMVEGGPVGAAVARVIRLGQIVLNEGPSGVGARVSGSLRRRLAWRPAAAGRTPARAAPRLTVPPMATADGVSILVLLSEAVTPLYDCIQAVIERTEPGTYEVIVVDVRRSEHGRWTLDQIAGVREIAAAPGSDAVAALAGAAAAARGRFLLFMRPEVLALEGWLPPLVGLLAEDESIAATAPLVLAASGAVRDAGEIVWRDGSLAAYGEGEEVRPEHLHRREVDAGAAGCLLVRRRAFEEAGGFDGRLAGTGYESADLCFELRRRGGRIVHQPRSRVVEMARSGGDQRLREAGRRDFATKHASALARQPAPGGHGAFRARDRRPGLRILLIDHMVPLFDRDSGSVRMLALLQILGRLGHAVTFLPDNLTPHEPYTSTLQDLGVEVVYGKLSVAEWLAARLADFDLVVLCRVTIASRHLASIVASAQRPPIVFDTVDLHFLREEREAAVLGDAARARAAAETRSTELAIARACDDVWVVSDYEAALLRDIEPALRVSVVPNIHSIRTAVPGFADRRDLLFIGGFRHPPNQDAVEHFVRDVFPRIRTRLSGVRFVAVGPDAPPSIVGLGARDVLIAGHVPDVEPVFDASRVFVAPLRYGAGLKGKIGQSLACGLPLVTTSMGAEGLPLVDGRHALIADEPRAFADAVVRLYEDPVLWARLSDEGRRLVDAELGPGAVTPRVEAALASASAGRGSGRV